MNRYFSSFFITTILYLVISFFLFYMFADTVIIKEEPKEIKISLKQIVEKQEPALVVEPVEEVPSKTEIVEQNIEPLVEIPTPIKKKIEKPKKEKVIEKKIVEKQDSKPIQEVEKVVNTTVVEKTTVEEKTTKQNNAEQIKNIENEYLGKVRNLIEQNKTYPKVARRLNQTGKVYVTFTVMKNGEIRNCKISNSSQFESLDEASINILNKIGSFESIPKELDKDSWEITIPIVYQIH